MNSVDLYIKAEMSIAITKDNVSIGDFAKIYCQEKNIKNHVTTLKIANSNQAKEGHLAISLLEVIQEINNVYPNVKVINVGAPDILVHFKKNKPENKTINFLKLAFICLLAFFGSAYAIISYNTDVNASDTFVMLYKLFMGTYPSGPSVLQLSYSIGLPSGVILYFNHLAHKNLSSDPSPLEVQMRTYEQEVNTALITNEGRKGKEIDVD
ncbi:MAG: stage V sporulation protein AA [Lachnospiraceae bacterium]|nr:stage V sporulation protein AA [Lachnospiraceae bacterium]